MKKKALSILLSLCLVLTLLPFSLSTLAAEVQDKPTGIYVMDRAGTSMIDAIVAAPDQLPEGMSYDAQTNTLTLDNVVITKSVIDRTNAGIAVYGSSNLTICLKGNSAIRPTSECVYGIAFLDGAASQQTAITGEGSLLIDGTSSGSINTLGSIVVDSSVSLLMGVGGSKFMDAAGGITIGGEAYTGTVAQGAIVNGKMIDKVRKTPLDLSVESVTYGAQGTFNPATESVTVEQTGEGWGWNHETKTLTMSGAVIYSTTGTYALKLPWASVQIELTDNTDNAVIGPDGFKVRAVDGSHCDLSIAGGGGLTALSGRAFGDGNCSTVAIEGQSLAISGSVRITTLSNRSGYISEGMNVSYQTSISDSARVLCVVEQSGWGKGIYVNSSDFHLSDDAYVEIKGFERSGLHIYSGNVEISGGTFIASSDNYGMQIGTGSTDRDRGNVRITGGTVECSGRFNGIEAKHDIIITGGSVTGTGGSYGGGTYAGLKSNNGAVTIAPAEKQLSVYAGEAAPGTKLAQVAVSNSYTLTAAEQKANLYVHVAYEPLQTKSSDVKGKTIPGGKMETVYSLEVSWGAMEFTYSSGNEGTWNPDTHQVSGYYPAGWQYAQGANQVRVVSHSNTPVNVAFAYTPDPGFETATGVFDKPSETLPSAIGTALDAAPSVTAALTMEGSLPESARELGKIGAITVTIDAAQ